MNDEIDTQYMAIIETLLTESGKKKDDSELKISMLAGDGSSRKFWRIMQADKRLCLAVAPPVIDALNLSEAGSARTIGLHLLQHGVRVPEQYGWDEESGLLLFEDLGDIKLHDFVLNEQQSDTFIDAVRSCYQEVVKSLVIMQIKGAKGFNTDWCWDTPKYDKSIMLERESAYFLRAFWQDYLGKEEPSDLQEEFDYLAERTAIIPATYFLHRDFQSRNIMLYGGKPCFIDFQGGRLGPLGYDLASLLIDPYAALPLDFQEELVGVYLDQLEELISVDRRKFVEEYLLLALHRNLQIVGAFAFLSKQRKKQFFEQYLRPAITSLNILLECEMFSDLRVLRDTAFVAEKLLG
jgi:aminoglycoside/choline kinase family phosphotransferase